MIRNLPQRYPEIGRIRLGEKGPKGEPRKGKTLRFSSDDDVVLKALASQLGGEPKEWPNGEQAWHLTTESASVPVLLPDDPLDTSYERWGSGGIARRCDGERCIVPVQSPDGGHMVEQDCACLLDGLTPGDRGDVKRGACQVTVRLRLVIPDVPGIGAWVCTSHSIYAAMELPSQVALLRAMAERGRLIPADFAIEPRTEKKPWEKYKRDYIVPVLRVRQSLAQLANGDSPLAIAAPTPALAAAPLGISCPECDTFTGPDKQAVAAHLIEAHNWTVTDGKVRPPSPAGAPAGEPDPAGAVPSLSAPAGPTNQPHYRYGGGAGRRERDQRVGTEPGCDFG